MTPAKLNGRARVLVVADRPLSEMVRSTLDHGLYDVVTESRRSAATARLRDWRPHLVIVDVHLGDGDASSLIGALLGRHRTPTIVITARGDLETKLAAFENGADDFIVAPVSPEELVARALALMRRTYGEGVPLVAVIRSGSLEIDLLGRTVRSGGSPVHLTAIERAMLHLLASSPGVTLAREAILDAIWGADHVAGSNLVDRHVRNLRVKLQDDWREPRFIETVPGEGYRFLALVEDPHRGRGGLARTP